MNTAYHRSQSGHREAANDQSNGNDVPPDDDLVAVLASRASVIAAAAAMGHNPAGGGNGKQREKAKSTEDEASSGDSKKDNDKTYRRAEREADAKAGIKPCPVKFPADLHQPLRQRVHESNAPEGSRALLALTSFALRPEFTTILHAIELRDDREALVEALQCIVQSDWLVKTAICLSEMEANSTTTEHRDIPILIDAIARNPAISNAIQAVTASPTLQRLCIAIADKTQLQSRLLDLAMRSGEAEFLLRMSQLSEADRDFLLTLLTLDAESKHALEAAAPYPEITRLIVKAGRNASIHAAIETVARNPAVAKTGLAVINGTGFFGWIARKAARVLVHRQQNDRR
jgi:hypothetical protein